MVPYLLWSIFLIWVVIKIIVNLRLSIFSFLYSSFIFIVSIFTWLSMLVSTSTIRMWYIYFVRGISIQKSFICVTIFIRVSICKFLIFIAKMDIGVLLSIPKGL